MLCAAFEGAFIGALIFLAIGLAIASERKGSGWRFAAVITLWAAAVAGVMLVRC